MQIPDVPPGDNKPLPGFCGLSLLLIPLYIPKAIWLALTRKD